jgi:hypothetical protein
MKAISIRQPWAWLIVNGYKDIENRTWATKYRGLLLIHASKGMTRSEYDDVEFFLTFHDLPAVRAIKLPLFEDLERGGVVGVSRVVDCVLSRDRFSPWHMEGQFGFHLQNSRPLSFVACKGALGLFDIEVTL